MDVLRPAEVLVELIAAFLRAALTIEVYAAYDSLCAADLQELSVGSEGTNTLACPEPLHNSRSRSRESAQGTQARQATD